MELVRVVIFLLLCALALGWLSRRAGLPYPIALVLGGAALGFVPGLPEMQLEPETLLALVLPPILYQAALLTSWRDFRANLRPIGLLAVGLVIVTTIVVGAGLKFLIPAIPWAAAFAFGAIISPPDAVAATAILSKLHMPRRIVTVLEGESLVNDASGLVLYKMAIAAVLSGSFSAWQASTGFIVIAAGGILIGGVVAAVSVRVHRHLGDPFIEVLASLTVPYVAYVLAESVHVSGVLAVVAAGLVRGRFAPGMVSAQMRILARSVWNILVFMLNSFIFLLIGVQLSSIVARLHGYSSWQLALYSAAISVVAILVRVGWVYPATYLPILLSPRLRRQQPTHLPGEVFILGWCGMRGIVSLAAAMALPVQLADGQAFPYRDLIIFLTFVVIAVTLVVQGLSLAPLIRWLKIGSDVSAEAEFQKARLALCRAAMAAVDTVDPPPPGHVLDRIHADLDERMATAKLELAAHGAVLPAAVQIRRAMVRAERVELIRIWQAGEISDDVLHHLEEQLDYEESRL